MVLQAIYRNGYFIVYLYSIGNNINHVFRINKSLQLHQFFSFALLFSAHILLLISASVATLLIFRSAKAVLILYLIIEGIMVIIGTTFPVTSKYLIPYWGMAIEDQTMTVAWKTALSLLITALSVLITIVFLKKHNPTETPKNT